MVDRFLLLRRAESSPAVSAMRANTALQKQLAKDYEIVDASGAGVM
jgi:hypothetical protein